ncbi:DeoR/GlpR family DNA-binding transcription regulator [Puniceicoccus vermicola]|uniref:DeoR/GlpR transcriptional regulator n=1 Tax=Puniceicoccus vermicola TaxID=388746 RepID=A0A7X1B1F4_9BACT|nr:DeoR/GlpR family DNA-binding transcription regulator [Puniceicoccus vermicola]MBC2603848.1 DeoR/GlpR transcriptional regulator [Puniceicoccus vermicola]
MTAISRQKQILDYVRKTERVSVQDLIDQLEASPATVRRDLVQLEEEGKVLRIHGAVLDRRSLEGEPSFSLKRKRAPEIKRRIGRAVADEIPPGSSVFIDAGTTCLEAGLELLARDAPYTLYTNSLPLMYHGGNHSSSLIAVGGEVRALTGALVGGMALEWVQHLHFDVAVLGASAVDPSHGLLTTELTEASVKKAVLDHAKVTILAADSGKLEESATVRFADWSHFNTWVTDENFPTAKEKEFRQKHPHLALRKTPNLR